MVVSNHYELNIPEKTDTLIETIERYKVLFINIDELIHKNRFIGNELTDELESKLKQLDLTLISNMTVAIGDLQLNYQDIIKSISILDSSIKTLNNLIGDAVNQNKILESKIDEIKQLIDISSKEQILSQINQLSQLLETVDVLKTLNDKAQNSDLIAISQKLNVLQDRFDTFDKFGIIKDECNDDEYYLTIKDSQIKNVKTDETLIKEVIDRIDIDYLVKGNLLFPIKLLECDIYWSSNRTDVIQTNGQVNKPKYNEEAIDVTLTASVTKSIYNKSKVIYVKVLPETVMERLIKDVFLLNIPDTINDSINLPTSINEIAIEWSSNNEEYLLSDGTLLKRPESNELNKLVMLIATCTLEDEVITKEFNIIIQKKEV